MARVRPTAEDIAEIFSKHLGRTIETSDLLAPSKENEKQFIEAVIEISERFPISVNRFYTVSEPDWPRETPTRYANRVAALITYDEAQDKQVFVNTKALNQVRFVD